MAPAADTPTLVAAIAAAAAEIAPISVTPRLDAELLMAHALGMTREAMLLGARGLAPPAAFAGLVARRAAGEPIAYIAGSRDFWTISLAVAPGVLIPRADSETLIEAAVAHFAGGVGPRTILDLGTGSGALLLAALGEWPAAVGVGIDASPEAVRQARANAARLGLSARARIEVGDWPGTGEAFDLLLCNPPYIAEGTPLPRDVAEHEPASALYAGADGLDAYRRLAPLVPRQIAPGGVGCIEIGADQGRSAARLFEAEGLAVRVLADLAGRDRCLVLAR